MRQLGNGLCVVLAFICIGIGCVGIVLPILPTTPFLFLALLLLARGSERFHRWFLKTGLYRKHIRELAETRAMTPGAKLRVLAAVTLLLAAGMRFSPPYARIILALVLIFHYGIFLFGIRTVGSRRASLSRDAGRSAAGSEVETPYPAPEEAAAADAAGGGR